MGAIEIAATGSLKNHVAVVTGASRGLGLGFARGLAAAGATVALVARSSEALIRAVQVIEYAGGRAAAYPLDVTDAPTVQRVVAQIEAEQGPIDILVNNAGTMAPLGRDWEVDPGDWWRTLEVNVLGTFLCSHAVLPGMINQRRGRIVNVSSRAAFKRYPFYSAYGASKAALTHLTASLAEATREFGVQVFAFSPGFVRTEMTESLANSPVFRRHLGDGMRRALEEGRHLPIEHAVEALLMLLVDDRDDLSGRYIEVTEDASALTHSAGAASGN